MRTFIAIELPAPIKAALAEAQNELRQTHAPVSWTKPEKLHLTLKFLGEIEPASVGPISRVCAEAARHCACQTLRLNGLGFFPNTRQPRVVWAGLSGDLDGLQQLQNQLEERLAAAGLARPDKPFRPHLTLGRIKTSKNIPPLVARAAEYQLPALSFTVSELVLMQSQLEPAGSIYTPLARAQLG